MSQPGVVSEKSVKTVSRVSGLRADTNGEKMPATRDGIDKKLSGKSVMNKRYVSTLQLRRTPYNVAAKKNVALTVGP